MTRKRAIKLLMGVAHFDRNTIQKAFADTHKEVPGSSNVQIAAILLENWEDAAIAASLEIFHLTVWTSTTSQKGLLLRTHYQFL